MRTDISRDTFRPQRRYSAVVMQQGRVLLDADWNEQQSILKHRDETEATDVIGRTGVPREGGGFEVTAPGDGSALAIGAGRLYVDGILCENPEIRSVHEQPELPAATDELPGFAYPTEAGRYLVYVDAWRREVTPLEDPAIREVALGGADTTTREQTVWQVRLVPAGDEGCGAVDADWAPEGSPTTGRMRAQVVADTGDEPCILAPGSGYRGLENQLYRVEVHEPGGPGTATFKVSRDNGSVVTGIAWDGGDEVEADSLGRDDASGFHLAPLVEVLDERKELLGEPGDLTTIVSADPATRVIQLADTPTELDVDRHPKLRRWDGSDTVQLPADADDWITLENGIQVQFSAGHYRTGDYWLIPARAATSAGGGTIEWPTDGAGGPEERSPDGVAHHYAALALVDFDGDVFTLPEGADCRLVFPPLTAITADDVAFDNDVCAFPDAATVQDALDAICSTLRGECAVVVRPGRGWESVLRQLPEGTSVRFCFQPGTYPLERTVTVRSLGHVTLTGVGPGTRIVAESSEAALLFDSCGHVRVEHLRVEGGAAGRGPGAHEHLNGALTFVDCEGVDLDRVSVRSEGGAVRGATCVTVRSGAAPGRPARPSTRIHGCRLEVGHMQAGILVVNQGRVHIEDNALRVGPRPASLGLAEVAAASRRARTALRRALVSNAEVDSAREEQPSGRRAEVRLEAGDGEVRFRTEPELREVWSAVIAAAPPERSDSPVAVVRHMDRLADRVLLDEAFRNRFAGLRDWFAGLRQEAVAFASQGIVVAGRGATDVRVHDNTLQGFAEGIRTAFSHKAGPSAPPDVGGRISICGNTMATRLPPEGARQAFGIFVGNCESLVVERNMIRLQRTRSTRSRYVEGVRVYGELGRSVVVRQNQLEGYTVGVRVRPLTSPSDQSFQWLVMDTLAVGSERVVRAPRSVRRIRNLS